VPAELYSQNPALNEQFSGAVHDSHVKPFEPQKAFGGLLTLPSPVLAAGDILKISLQNDASGNVTGVTFSVTRGNGVTVSPYTP
jgi:hypothetical protein